VSELPDEIPTRMIEPMPEPLPNKTYVVKNVELVRTMRRGLEALRVTLEDTSGTEYTTMLWLREAVGPASKLGAFIGALGRNPKQWIGKKIRITNWSQRSREIQLAR